MRASSRRRGVKEKPRLKNRLVSRESSWRELTRAAMKKIYWLKSSQVIATKSLKKIMVMTRSLANSSVREELIRRRRAVLLSMMRPS